MSVVVLAVSRTWDGSALAEDEVARLAISNAGPHLRVCVDVPYSGDPPPDAPPGPTDALWEREVVEWFVAGADGSYLEVELGPHGHHLVLQLSGVRKVTRKLLPMDYAARIDGGRWTGEALVPRDWLPPPPWTTNAYAIRGVGASRRYFSMVALPGDKPDFHQPDRFVPVDLS